MLKAFAEGRLFGSMHGAGGPPVLALHGWGRTHEDFAAVLDGLDTTCVAVDLPGFGATPPPPDAWGGVDYAGALVPVLDEMAEPAVILGHSFGGRAAVHLAARHPGRVRALVLTGVPNLVRIGGHKARRPPLLYRLGRSLHRRRLLNDRRMERLRQRYGSNDYRNASGVMRAVHVRAVNEFYEAELAAISAPVELVWGDDDSAAPLAVAKAACERLERATLTIVPGAGHLTPLTAPGALRDAVSRWLAL